jgi:ribosomal protein S12 methylthiotransferase accessory factor
MGRQEEGDVTEVSHTADPAPAADATVSPERALLDRLSPWISPLGGLVGNVRQLPQGNGAMRFAVCSAQMGDIGMVATNVDEMTRDRPDGARGELDGAGGSLDPERASLLAVMEALERYACSTWRPDECIWERATVLGGDALDLATVPRCSPAELAHPLCPVVEPDPDGPMRWVKGVSLTTGRTTWIPLVLAYLYVKAESRAERFTLPISTGCAAHTDPVEALLTGLCEVIERDLISTVWLQRMPIAELDPASFPAETQPALQRLAASDSTIRFFDGTTDLGLPIVYTVEESPCHPTISTIVMCAAGPDPAALITKVLRESTSSRLALEAMQPKHTPRPIEHFINVFDGALHLAPYARRGAFSFLLDQSPTADFARLPDLSHLGSLERLVRLVDRLADIGAEVFAVDTTTDELRRLGVCAVRVIVPALQPLSFAYLAQYRAHPRLQELPRKLGFPASGPDDMNSDPQPFA